MKRLARLVTRIDFLALERRATGRPSLPFRVRRLGLSRIVIGLAALSLSLAATRTFGAQREENARLDILSFGSLHGEITDCGCKSDPRGGLPYRMGLADSLRAADVPFLHLDLGNFANEVQGVNEMVTRFIWDAMANMEVDATTPGPRELEQWKLYEEFIESELVPVVSTNMRVVRDGQEQPIGQPSLLVERNGIKIGLIGLIGGSQFTRAKKPADVEIHFMDPFGTAQEEVAKLGAEADLIVLMSQMSRADTDRLIKEVPGIDVALYGSLPAWKEASGLVGTTITQETGSRGQYVGHLTVTVDPAGSIIEHHSSNSVVWAPLPLNEEMDERVQKFKLEVDAIRKGAVGVAE